MPRERVILHVDMDAFFAQIEQRDRPELRGKPVVVGGPHRRGVVSSASYEAREYGVYSGMPIKEAAKACPHAVFLPVDMEKYLLVSEKLRKVLESQVPVVEMASCDEAYLDVTGCGNLLGSPVSIALRIKREIRNSLDLTASVGVSYNKFLAKMASDMQKPDDLTVISSGDLETKVWPLSVDRLRGVGKATAARLKSAGLETIGDVARASPERLVSLFGCFGERLHRLANGIDETELVPTSNRKSVSRERTFGEDVAVWGQEARREIQALSERVAASLRRHGLCAHTVTLKVRFADFKTVLRSRSMPVPLYSADSISRVAISLLVQVPKLQKRVRLIGVGVSNLVPFQAELLTLFGDEERRLRLEVAIEKLRLKFGQRAVLRGLG